MKKDNKKDNNVHLHGFINDIRSNPLPDGKTIFNLAVTTIENYKNAEGAPVAKYTNHNVTIASNDAAFVAKMEEFRQDLQENREQANNKEYKRKTHTVSLDGTFTVSKGNDEKTYYGIAAKPEDVKFDVKQEEKEVRNTAEITGVISSIDFPEKDGSKLGFANVSIAAHYYVPGESANHLGEVKPYTEKTTFIPLRVDQKMMPKTFEDLVAGKIEVGDLMVVRGTMHNNNYTNADGKTVYRTVIDVKKAELIAKKGQKKAQAEEEKTEAATKTATEAPKDTKTKKAEVKKAAPRKKGVTM